MAGAQKGATHAGRTITWVDESGFYLLPGYAPDLNPLDQGVWHYLKHVELANVCCMNDQHLRQELHRAMARLRHKPHIIQGAIRHAGYHL